MIDLSVVVVTWNARELVSACLERLAREIGGGRSHLAVETLVVDNGSDDGTLEALRERFAWVEPVALPRNRGFAAGANAGLARARGRHVLLLNNDALVTREAVERCVAVLDAHPEVGAVGPQLVHADGRLQNSVHAFPGLVTELLPAFVRETLWPRRYPSKRTSARAGEGPVEVEALLGAALFARREVWERVGPLDEGYFFFLEETDWCWRMRRAGYRVWHLPQVRMTHVSGASSKRVAVTRTRTRIEFHRSLYRFLRLRRGRATLALVVALRLLRNALPLVVPPLGPRARARWRDRVALVGWHLRGCPSDAGLAGLPRDPAAIG